MHIDNNNPHPQIATPLETRNPQITKSGHELVGSYVV